MSPYFDVGYTLDPVGEFLQSLDKVDALDTRLALAGHARPFTDVRGAHRREQAAGVRKMGDAVRDALADGPRTAFELAQTVYADAFHPGDGELAADDDPGLARPSPGVGRGVEHDDRPVEHWSQAS